MQLTTTITWELHKKITNYQIATRATTPGMKICPKRYIYVFYICCHIIPRVFHVGPDIKGTHSLPSLIDSMQMTKSGILESTLARIY